MISLPSGTHIWIAAGVTDLRRGFTGLSAIAQTALEQNPYSGHVFVFRGSRGDLVKPSCCGGTAKAVRSLARAKLVGPCTRRVPHFCGRIGFGVSAVLGNQ
ncbi:MAG: IS66 family insertion sequence element accessory protein TnpB [Bryobacteraceae bacterium]